MCVYYGGMAAKRHLKGHDLSDRVSDKIKEVAKSKEFKKYSGHSRWWYAHSGAFVKNGTLDPKLAPKVEEIKSEMPESSLIQQWAGELLLLK